MGAPDGPKRFCAQALAPMAPAPELVVTLTGRAREAATNMLFGKRQRLIRRILIVEDEPLVAFDNEHLLKEAEYDVVATVDSFAEARAVIDAHPLDLILSDIELNGDGDGIDVARAAVAKGIPVLFVTGNCSPEAQQLAVGCLAKPYSGRVLLDALAAVDARLQGRAVKPSRQLTLYATA